MPRDDFAVFILTFGRPNRVLTYDSLKKWGYTGKTYLIVSEDDDKLQDYIDKFGEDMVVRFNKQDVLDDTDTMDSSNDLRGVIFARNISFKLAKELGITYFLQLDDDYKEFQFRYPDGDKLRLVYPKSLDDAFMTILDYYESNEQILSIALAQGGDFIGGLKSSYSKKVLRKCMNSFFCSVNRPFKFIGRINEDTNTYTLLGTQGKLFLTITDMMINQPRTQYNGGGLTELYLDSGTYVKSFFSVIACPSCVKVSLIGENHFRIHHKVNWNNCTPMILSDRFRKV